ncbi:DNA topoisomerase-1 [Dethiosulfatibacter aminovorans DSM 17477]|uniref:DNA topoisomerase 1 n=1 Tax=Dethiosulfatibacter aminovorans DSM 17477 TaxID=1121476 RepID=A0A1M6DF94_9FIRM|nr:type I DNA topoisomerase [Dethiosulfatibacter aminovorans]SHI71751.1 DNA topoisomerase-1 [Dethiosulfatibacter aminovorans DSM 17477]
MAKNLVIVESPSKAKTIGKFLGKNYKVKASVGHLRDLPKSKLGIDVEDNFNPNYITIRGKGDIIKELKKEAKKADHVYLATDPDREGEAISWHLAEILKLDPSDNIRIVFNEITKNAITNAKKNPRSINQDLVDAQQARRILDRLVGYKISPLLWRKIEKGLSAGRVQSVAVKLIYDREKEIENFVPEEYWTIDGEFGEKKTLEAKFAGELNDSRVKKISISSREEADKLLEVLRGKDYGVIEKITNKKTKKSPPPPFTTSSLQQDANRQLNFSTKKTMMIAQQLYEGVELEDQGTTGLITYIRTDSYRISDEAKKEAAEYLEESYGKDYVNISRVFKTKKKTDIQDAHEAIRPSTVYNHPDRIKESLTNDQYKLYRLIWKRFLASCMESAEFENLTILINVEGYAFRYSGKRTLFDGYMKVLPSKDKIDEFPELEQGKDIKIKKILEKQNFTNPPARYNEASLVKTMEELGIGRPSTYAPTVSTILNRGYVVKNEGVFNITEIGEIVTELLIEHFSSIINDKFTADLENKLDEVESGSFRWQEVIEGFYKEFEKALALADKNIEKIEIEEEITDIECEKCGSKMVVKKGRFGKFLACPNYPECKNTKPYDAETGEAKVSDVDCDKCGARMVIKKGRYGEFLACPNYPECKNTKQIEKTIDVKCPKCGGDILEKRTKKGRKFYGCSNYPECDFTAWNEPVNEKCPVCGGLQVKKKTRDGEVIVCTNENCEK